jgi:hypothetical protein
MTLISEILSRRMGLPRAQTRDVVRERDLRVEMDDGAVLLADRWVAKDARDRPQPTVLLRSCYGRGHVFGLVHGRLLAERGLQVVIQSVRGTFGSEGKFNPFEERGDGLATLAAPAAMARGSDRDDRLELPGPCAVGNRGGRRRGARRVVDSRQRLAVPRAELSKREHVA